MPWGGGLPSDRRGLPRVTRATGPGATTRGCVACGGRPWAPSGHARHGWHSARRSPWCAGRVSAAGRKCVRARAGFLPPQQRGSLTSSSLRSLQSSQSHIPSLRFWMPREQGDTVCFWGTPSLRRVQAARAPPTAAPVPMPPHWGWVSWGAFESSGSFPQSRAEW